jgi:ribonuclease HII
MQECILKLDPRPVSIIVDGNSPYSKRYKKIVVEFYSTEIEILNSIPNASIIKGDSKL